MSEPGSLIRSLSGRNAVGNFHARVISDIGGRIISGTYPPGSILPNDAELMAIYDVSRTVLREALKTLEAKGLVEARPKVGTKITRRNRWSLFDPQVLTWHLDHFQVLLTQGPALTRTDRDFLAGLREVRLGLEPQAAADLAASRTGDQIRLMHYWLRQMETCQTEGQNLALADFELHRIIADACRNPFLPALQGVIELSHALFYAPSVAGFGAVDLPPLLDRHLDLIQAIERQQTEAAADAMRACIHLENAMVRIDQA